jgi:hypothetical protein
MAVALAREGRQEWQQKRHRGGSARAGDVAGCEQVRADLNARREKAEQDFKDQHAALLIKYKEPDTEAFI